MNVDAFFDKLVTDLTDLGVTEGRDEAGARLLLRDGVAFARLGDDERMAFRAVGDPVAEEAVGEMAAVEDRGDWVVVPADDVASWEGLARRALTGV